MTEPLDTQHTEDPIVDFEADIPEEKELPSYVPEARKPQKVELTEPYSHTGETNAEEILDLPSDFPDRVYDSLNKSNKDNVPDTPETVEWAEGIKKGLGHVTYDQALTDRLSQEESAFRQYVEHNGAKLAPMYPTTKSIENKVLQGEPALMHIFSYLGLGNIFQVPLWHSGFWVTFKPPTESAIIELSRQLMNEKITLGRSSYGLIYSNFSYYMVDRLTAFICEHIYSTTVDGITKYNILQHMRVQDLYPFIWGFVCTMYPRGFKYHRSCTNNPENCQHILEETLNLTKLLWTDTKAFNEEQLQHMASRRPNAKKLEEVIKYQESLTCISNFETSIRTTTNPITVILKSPTVSEYIDSGHNWLSAITEMVDKVTQESDEISKDEIILTHSKATMLRIYGHWISGIRYMTNEVSDDETVNKILSIISADTVAREGLLKAISDYINRSTLSLIGLPTYECPNCKKDQSVITEGTFMNVIPLDVLQVFFSLLTLRLENIARR